jgi:hypothetical protein
MLGVLFMRAMDEAQRRADSAPRRAAGTPRRRRALIRRDSSVQLAPRSSAPGRWPAMARYARGRPGAPAG